MWPWGLPVKLSRLIYRSTAAAEIVPNALLRDIETRASAANAATDITGLLVLAGNVFVQVLEGDALALTWLFSRIATDKRHRQIELITHQRVATRMFDDWSMRLVDLYDLPGDKRHFMIAKYGRNGEQLMIPEDADALLAWLLDARFLCLSAPWNSGNEAGRNGSADRSSAG